MALSNEEIRAEVQRQKEDKDRAERIKGLLKQPGWSDYQDLLNHHVGVRTQGMFEPLQTDNESLKQEHNKGVIYGLIFARDLLGVILMAQKEAPASEDDTDA